MLREPAKGVSTEVASVTGARLRHPAGKAIETHHHAEGQFSVVLSGTVRFRGEAGWWLAPPGRGIWIPAQTPHSASYSETSEFILLKIHPDFSAPLPAGPTTIAVSNLLRELALELSRLDRDSADPDYAELVSRLVLRQIGAADQSSVLFLPAGQDPRLCRVTERLRAHPELNASLDELVEWAGSSRRTMARLFVAETGMTFARWRDHLRIVTAMDMLVRGRSITQVAFELGFQGQSSFTTMFTRVMGMPPGRLMRQMSESEPAASETGRTAEELRELRAKAGAVVDNRAPKRLIRLAPPPAPR